AVGPYENGRMYTLAELRAEQGAGGQEALDALLLPVDSAIADWPVIRLDRDMSFYVRRGQAVLVLHAPTQGWVRLYDAEGGFLGIGEVADDGRITPKRLLASA